MKKGTILAIVSAVATLFATTIATSACFWYVYQPSEPECLRDM